MDDPRGLSILSHGSSMDKPWMIYELSMDQPWMSHGVRIQFNGRLWLMHTKSVVLANSLASLEGKHPDGSGCWLFEMLWHCN